MLAAVAVATPATAQAQAEQCRAVSVPVSVAGHELTMHGELCQPTGKAKNLVQVLVPGATYNQSYWNFPYHPEIYNFRLAMNRAGFATVTVDRLGTGSSSRAPSAVLTSNSQAYAVHQMIQALRDGRLGEKFDKVIVGGHSLGSAISMLEASTYQDVDGVLLTGVTHRINLVNDVPILLEAFRPAMLDPHIGSRGYDPGYLTTAPGTRARAFYAPGSVEPGVERTDEETKDVTSVTEVGDAVATFSLPITRAIKVPVMLANGAHDLLMCNAGTDCRSAESLKATEGAYFSPEARLRTFSLPGFGHSINLAPNTRDYQRAVIDWATEIAEGNRAASE